MRRLIKKLIAFVLIVYFLMHCYNQLLPYYWGNQGWVTKMDLLKSQPNEYNTFFIGSSRIYRQVNPMVFDSISKTTNSFNLGFAATFNPETYYLLNGLLKDDDFKVRNLVVEMQPLIRISKVNNHTRKVKYFMNFRMFKFVFKHFFNSPNYSLKAKIKTLKAYFISYGENLFNIGLLKDSIEYFRRNGDFESKGEYYRLGHSKRGFLSLQEQLMLYPNNHLQERVNEFKADSSQSIIRKKILINSKADSSNFKLNSVHNDYVHKLIKIAGEKNIHIVFVLPPKLSRLSFKQVYPIFKKLPQKNKIDLLDPMKYPEFYKEENSFDIGHLNDNGSEIFTKSLAQKFVLLAKN